jgi:hypothetical protein
MDKAPLIFETHLGMLRPANAAAGTALREIKGRVRVPCEQNMNLLENQRLDGCSNTAPSLTKNRDRSAIMADSQLPTPDELRQLLRYEAETGRLYWREREPRHFRSPGNIGLRAVCSNWNRRYAGNEAFRHTNAKGYRQGTLASVKVEAHRVAWAVHHGYWPQEIDHINGDKGDNRPANLREVTRQQNSCNRSQRSDNRTGVTGVVFKNGRYVARIQANGKERFLGSFSSLDAARTARKGAERELGYHENHGRAG